jgi:phosphatidylglycerol lysyltransferase
LVRGPAVLLHALEWLLVPWTMLIAMAPTTSWFPSAIIHSAWVGFDIALFFALRALRRGGRSTARRWRLSRMIAGAVTADAILTIAQAIWWNRTTVSGAVGWSIVLIACLGPMLAAVVLWGATRRLEQLIAD